MKKSQELKFLVGGKWRESASGERYEIRDPSTGEIIALAPRCSRREVEEAVEAASAAFPFWSATPVARRAQVLYKFRELLTADMEALADTLCRENGKCLDEARGDVLKAREIVEFACGAPSLMMGESLMNASPGFDTVLYREPVGVFVGLAPWNFPAMIPMGWMVPLCVATGNTMVLKASSNRPRFFSGDSLPT